MIYLNKNECHIIINCNNSKYNTNKLNNISINFI